MSSYFASTCRSTPPPKSSPLRASTRSSACRIASEGGSSRGVLFDALGGGNGSPRKRTNQVRMVSTTLKDLQDENELSLKLPDACNGSRGPKTPSRHLAAPNPATFPIISPASPLQNSNKSTTHISHKTPSAASLAHSLTLSLRSSCPVVPRPERELRRSSLTAKNKRGDGEEGDVAQSSSWRGSAGVEEVPAVKKVRGRKKAETSTSRGGTSKATPRLTGPAVTPPPLQALFSHRRTTLGEMNPLSSSPLPSPVTRASRRRSPLQPRCSLGRCETLGLSNRQTTARQSFDFVQSAMGPAYAVLSTSEIEKVSELFTNFDTGTLPFKLLSSQLRRLFLPHSTRSIDWEPREDALETLEERLVRLRTD